MPVPSKCCCGCTRLNDTFTRSGADIDADGVNVPGGSTYSFASGSWAIASNKLKCITAGEPITFASGDARVSVSMTLNALGDYAELSNGTDTVRCEIITGGTGYRAMATTFAGSTVYQYGFGGSTSDIALPQTQTISIELFHCDPDQPSWNVQLCKGQNGECEGTDYVRSLPFVKTVSTTIGSSYTWTLTASANVLFDNLLVQRNTDACTSEPSIVCADVCCGAFPGSIELTISGFEADCGIPCCSDREAFNDCQADCDAIRTAGYADVDAAKWAYYYSHGNSFVGFNICAEQEPVEQAYVECMCDCTKTHWQCKTSAPCESTLNGTHVFEQWTDTINAQIPTNAGCRYYYCMIPVDAFWRIKDGITFTGDCTDYEEVSNRYLYAHITLSYRFYSAVEPKRSQISYQLWLPTRGYTAITSGQRSWNASDDSSSGGRYVDATTWCGGGDMRIDAPSEYADEWRMNTTLARPSAPSGFYSASLPKDQLTCEKPNPLNCGESVAPCEWAVSETTDPDTLETTITYEPYEYDLPTDGGIQCGGSGHVPLTLTLESLGA